MSKYVANRRDVCAGQLVKNMNMSYRIYDFFGNEVNEEQLKEQGISFAVSGSLVCRGMLFNVNEDGLSNDLIYNTPANYPIEGISPKIDIQSDFVIEDYVELDELLKYLKYGVDLTQHDLNQIYRKLINRNWWLKHHMELFGWKKDEYGYSIGDSAIIPMSIYDSLSRISCYQNGKPHSEEPSYRLIKKRKR